MVRFDLLTGSAPFFEAYTAALCGAVRTCHTLPDTTCRRPGRAYTRAERFPGDNSEGAF